MFTKLNRVLLASGLAVASAAMLSPASFAVDTQSNILSGNVVDILDIAWNNFTPTFTIVQAAGSRTIGDITTSSNVAAYKVFAKSDNGALLSDGAGTPKTVAYTLSLAGGGATDLSPNTAGTAVLLDATTGAAIGAQTLTLNTVANLLPAGDYTDTLTLTIVKQ
jgi:hypothetical protein